MENIEELLPGIEEFLAETLACEKLTGYAEQKRLYFLERLDIVKLPPTVPPREGRNLPQELLKDTEEKNGIPSSSQNHKRPQQKDFAATQREIARSWAGSNSQVTEESREDVHDGDNDSIEKVKVYDDIDIADISTNDDDEKTKVDNPYDDEDIDDLDTSGRPCSIVNQLNPNNDGDDDDEQEEENDYEIPVAMQQLPEENGDQPSHVVKAAESTEELRDDIFDTPAGIGPPPVPPPLPPRRDIRFSDSGSRSSINGLTDDAPPDLPYRPPLPRRSELCGRSERSDRSDPDLSGDGGSTSYESFDEDDDPNTAANNKPSRAKSSSIKLPTRPSKKRSTLKMSKKLSKSRSSSQWEISVPFRKLEHVELSGELLHKGKLTWNRRMVAITNGCLAMYKPDKDVRPLLVIPLMGYEAIVGEKKEGRRGFEIKMTHQQDDTHVFSVDVKDWANTWKEHINNQAKGQRSSSNHPIHLSRTLSSDLSNVPSVAATLPAQTSNNNHGSKTDLNGSTSNVSTGSEGVGADDAVVRPRMRAGNKVMRMGSFAFRATQFFENISKKSSAKRKLSSQSYSGEGSSSNPNTGNNNAQKTRGISLDLHEYSSNNSNNHSNIVEESSISSNSTGNFPPPNFTTPTSDISMPVFSDSNSNPSSLPNSPVDKNSMVVSLGSDDLERDARCSSPTGAEIVVTKNDQNNLQDVTQRGYLIVFSTFNRRRWGKRWCLVRGNMFECYRSEHQPVTHCELSFLLKACVLRRAVVETNSQLGLMLVDQEKDKEKITVEPVCPKEMPAWVQILMAETSTPSVPDGLEEYMKPNVTRRSSDAPSILSLSVLKQWDMDITLQSLNSSKDNASPEDPSSPRLLSSTAKNSSECEYPSEIDSGNVEEESHGFVQESCGPSVADNIKKKHTTDSGFYSVKGNNSDSDGEHVHITEKTEMERAEGENVNCGYAVIEPSSPHSRKPSINNINSHQSNKSDESSTAEISTSSNVSCVISSSHQFTNEEDDGSSTVPYPSTTTAVSSLPLASSSPSSLSPSSPLVSQPFSHSQSSSKSTCRSSSFHVSNTQRSSSDQKTPQRSMSIDYGTQTTKRTDEYSQVIKRSLRKKSKMPEHFVTSNGDTIQYEQQISQTSSESCESKIDNNSDDTMVFGEVNSDTEEFEEVQELPIAHKESIYEDVEPQSNINITPHTPVTVEIDKMGKIIKVRPVEETSEMQGVLQCDKSFNEEAHDIRIGNFSFSSPKNTDDHSISPVCSVNPSDNQHEGSESNEPTSSTLNLQIFNGKLTTDEGSTPQRPKLDPIIITPISLHGNTMESLDIHQDHSPSISSCHSPEIPHIEVNKPGMNEEELREAIDKLKQKKSQLKRKRLAVHDKRQRVSSDEQRLACEKEFASLERAVENTDKDIGFLQNQLDILCGHSLESVKMNSKKKTGSKKRKPKKKAH